MVSLFGGEFEVVGRAGRGCDGVERSGDCEAAGRITRC